MKRIILLAVMDFECFFKRQEPYQATFQRVDLIGSQGLLMH